MSDLRDRIAAVLASDYCTYQGVMPCKRCIAIHRGLADAVIAELIAFASCSPPTEHEPYSPTTMESR